MKRVLIVLCIIFISFLVSLAQVTIKVDGLIYDLKNIGKKDPYAVLSQATLSAVKNGHVNVPTTVKHEGNAYEVREIKNECFKNDNYIKTISLPLTLTSIGDSAFYNSRLQSISIPPSVKKIGNHVFDSCFFLELFVLEATTDTLRSGSYVFKNAKLTEVVYQRPTSLCFGSTTNNWYARTEKLTIGGNVTVIPPYVFDNLKYLSEVIVNGDSLTSIGKHAFYNCKSIDEFVFPSSLRQIDKGAFAYAKLKRVDLTDTQVDSLSIGAFSSATVQHLSLPKNMKKIPALFCYYSTINKIDIPDGVTSIGRAAFSDCDGLSELVLPNSITEIKSEAFSKMKCDKVVIPSGITRIEAGNCNGTYIKEFIFEDNKEPLYIDLGVNARDEVHEFEIPGSPNEKLMSAYIGRPIVFNYKTKKRGAATFESSPIRKVEFGPNGRLVEGMFSGCSYLWNVIFPENVLEIPKDCFKDCPKLSNVILPVGVRKLGSHSFYGCALQEISVRSITPPECGDDVFGKEAFYSGTLRVPAESVAEYESTMPWLLFNKIRAKDFPEIDSVDNIGYTAPESPVEWYNLSGVRVSGEDLPAGIYIRRQGSDVTKVVIP